MENGIILNKLAQIEPYLARLEQVLPASFQDFEQDWKAQMIIERGLQVLIEIMIDVANRIIALNGWGPTTSSADAIRLLSLKKILSSDQPYLKMIQFRNFIVHGYDKVDLTVVYAIVTRNLPDVRRFKDEIITNG